jgi:hypothetical protein
MQPTGKIETVFTSGERVDNMYRKVGFLNSEFLFSLLKNETRSCNDTRFKTPVEIFAPPQTYIDVYFNRCRQLGPILMDPKEICRDGMLADTLIVDNDAMVEIGGTYLNTDEVQSLKLTFDYPLNTMISGYVLRPINKYDSKFENDFTHITTIPMDIPRITAQQQTETAIEQLDFAAKKIQVPKIYESFFYTAPIGTNVDDFIHNGKIHDVADSGEIEKYLFENANAIWLPSGTSMEIECGGKTQIFGPYDVSSLLDVSKFPTYEITKMSFDSVLVETHRPIFDTTIFNELDDQYETDISVCIKKATEDNTPYILKLSAFGKTADYRSWSMDAGKTALTSDTRICGVIIPPYIELRINDAVLGPYIDPCFVSIREGETVDISWRPTLAYCPERAAVAQSIQDDAFFFSDKDEDSKICELKSGTSHTYRWKIDDNDVIKKIGPFTKNVFLYSNLKKGDYTLLSVDQGRSLFQKIFGTKRGDIPVAVDLNSGYSYADVFDDAVVVKSVSADTDIGDDTLVNLRKQYQSKITEVLTDSDIPVLFKSSLSGKNIYLPALCQIFMENSTKSIIMGPYSFGCTFEVNSLDFVPNSYRLFAFGQQTQTTMTRENVTTVLQNSCVKDRRVVVHCQTGTDFVDSNVWKGSGVQKVSLPRATCMQLSSNGAAALTRNADSIYGPFDYDVEISVPERFLENVYIETRKQYNRIHKRGDAFEISRKMTADLSYTDLRIQYREKNTTDADIWETVPLGKIDDNQPRVLLAKDFSFDLENATITALEIPADHSVRIVLESTLLNIPEERENFTVYVGMYGKIKSIQVAHVSDVPFMYRTRYSKDELRDDAINFMDNLPLLAHNFQNATQICIPSATTFVLRVFGSDFTCPLGPYLEDQILDFGKSFVSNSKGYIQLSGDPNPVIVNDAVNSSVDVVQHYGTLSNVNFGFDSQRVFCEAFESLSPSSVYSLQVSDINRVLIPKGWNVALYTGERGTGYVVTFDSSEKDLSVNLTDSIFRRAKSYTAFKMPKNSIVQHGIDAVKVQTKRMTTGKLWSVVNGLSAGNDIKPTYIEPTEITWSFETRNHGFYGFETDDDALIEDANDEQIKIFVKRDDVWTEQSFVVKNKYILFGDIKIEPNPENKWRTGNQKEIVGAIELSCVGSSNTNYGLGDGRIRKTFLPSDINDAIDFDSVHEEMQLIYAAPGDVVVLPLKNGTTLETATHPVGLSDVIVNSSPFSRREPHEYPVAFTSRVFKPSGVCVYEELYFRIVYEHNDHDIGYQIPLYNHIQTYFQDNQLMRLFDKVSTRDFDVIVSVILAQRQPFPMEETNGCVQMDKLNISYYDFDTRRVEILTPGMVESIENPGGKTAGSEGVGNLLVDTGKWCDQNFIANGHSTISIRTRKPILIVGIDIVTSGDCTGRDPKAFKVESQKALLKFRCVDDNTSYPRNSPKTFIMEEVPWGIFNKP